MLDKCERSACILLFLFNSSVQSRKPLRVVSMATALLPPHPELIWGPGAPSTSFPCNIFVCPVYFCFIFPQPNEREEKLMKARKKIATREREPLSLNGCASLFLSQANVCPFIIFWLSWWRADFLRSLLSSNFLN